MEEIQYFLLQNHQNNVQFKIIHLLRDPRGKINSQLQWKKTKKDFGNRYVSNLCRRQLRDITLRKEMEKMYPKMFMEILYENVASNTLKMAEKIYRFSFGESVPEHVKQWILLNTSNNNTTVKEAHYNTVRRNSTATSLAWKHQLSTHNMHTIEKECKQLLDHLNLV